ncbi:hypothetical protein FB382_004035 [Nocardioides ginsengisegetis]|uniref:Uncharacterized protein n=1 Tax=Nocardioides ginsengisegetis TaxID=661491 RepID=A0A7W3J3M2_9ACTN|nr:hypothetical protein [Nocardioides ginsengisegetis]MBA8805690.1 hypothetical protein [Nocardioides ginsengisegetis]
MKPLQSIAMGLLVVVLSARFHGYDALADPFGWLLVLLGLRDLPAELVHRSRLTSLAVLAAAVSVVLWFPAVTDALYDQDASLGWAANLPQVGFMALLCHALAARAAAVGDTRAARWLGLLRTGSIVVGLLPVLVFGAGMDSLEDPTYLAAGMVAVALIWGLFSWNARPWALAGVQQSAAGPPATS